MQKTLKYQIKLTSAAIINEGKTVRFEHLMTNDLDQYLTPEIYQVNPLSISALGATGEGVGGGLFVRRPGTGEETKYMFLDYPNLVTCGEDGLVYDCVMQGGRADVLITE